jgi:hypothetical protein
MIPKFVYSEVFSEIVITEQKECRQEENKSKS